MFFQSKGAAFYIAVLFLCTFALFNFSHHISRRLTVVEVTSPEDEDDPEYSRFQLQHCQCLRRIKRPNSDEEVTNLVDETPSEILYNQTTCSRDAFARGAGQKVVAFSFYGNINATEKEKGYFEGIQGNLDLMPKIYPGWTMRVYFDLDPSDPIMEDLCNLACDNNILDLCHAGDLPGMPMRDARKVFPMNWRFFPTLDPQVDVYNCRDLDSRLNHRELAAVNEWLEIGEPVHSMRDHPAHFTAMLGAAWGADLRRKNSRSKWRKSWKKIFKDRAAWAGRDKKGPDQEILQSHVWPWARHESVQHDSYLCQSWPNTIPFPVERKNGPNNFVAAVVKQNATLWQPCPKKCRPKDHPDWHVWPWAQHLSVQHDSYLCQSWPNTIPFPVERRNETNNFVAAVVKENNSLWKPCPKQCRPQEHPEWEHC